VTVPVGATAEVMLPLLGAAASEVDLYEGCTQQAYRSGQRVWRAGAIDDKAVAGVDALVAVVGPEGNEAIRAGVGAGVFSFCAVFTHEL
jgi:hypothetical protein